MDQSLLLGVHNGDKPDSDGAVSALLHLTVNCGKQKCTCAILATGTRSRRICSRVRLSLCYTSRPEHLLFACLLSLQSRWCLSAIAASWSPCSRVTKAVSDSASSSPCFSSHSFGRVAGIRGFTEELGSGPKPRREVYFLGPSFSLQLFLLNPSSSSRCDRHSARVQRQEAAREHLQGHSLQQKRYLCHRFAQVPNTFADSLTVSVFACRYAERFQTYLDSKMV